MQCAFFFLALKTGSCKTTYGQRISSSSFSLANGIPLWYAFSDWVVGGWVGVRECWFFCVCLCRALFLVLFIFMVFPRGRVIFGSTEGLLIPHYSSFLILDQQTGRSRMLNALFLFPEPRGVTSSGKFVHC